MQLDVTLGETRTKLATCQERASMSEKLAEQQQQRIQVRTTGKHASGCTSEGSYCGVPFFTLYNEDMLMVQLPQLKCNQLDVHACYNVEHSW